MSFTSLKIIVNFCDVILLVIKIIYKNLIEYTYLLTILDIYLKINKLGCKSFSAHFKEEQAKSKRGRGAAGKKNVVVMAESTPVENLETGEKNKQVRYFKAKVLDTHSAQEINQTVDENLDDKTIVFSDKSTSYLDIADYLEMHITEKSNKETTEETLKWVHIFISNVKRNLLGNYHKIKGKYLQRYLDEFVYKLNRRYFGDKLFDRVVIASITGL